MRDLLPSFAMEMDRPVDEVQAVVTFYYKTIRQKLSGLESVNVKLENLGTFYIKERSLHSHIEMYEKHMDKIPSDKSIEDYERKQGVKKKVDLMKEMVSKVANERSRRRTVIDKRFNNEPRKEHNQDLEEQGSDLGGSDE